MLVRINLDPPQEIARLNGLNEELAGRIVACRQSGYLFIGPEDLTQVEGIDLEMAFRMAGEIDWEAPQPPVRAHAHPQMRQHKRVRLNWSAASFHSLAMVILFWLLVARVLPMMALAITIGYAGQGWPMAHILGMLVLAVFFMLLGSLTSAMLALSRQASRARKGIRVRSVFSLLAVASLLLALAMSAVMQL